MPWPSDGRALVMVDYGSATGRNSADPVLTVIEVVRRYSAVFGALGAAHLAAWTAMAHHYVANHWGHTWVPVGSLPAVATDAPNPEDVVVQLPCR
jgi:hypothetical protein